MTRGPADLLPRNRAVVTFGELLVRLSPPGHERLEAAHELGLRVGGAEANVAVLLSRLGTQARMVSRVPDNALGRRVRNELARWGVDVSGVVTGGERLGLYFLEAGSGLRPSRVLYDRDHSSFSTLIGSEFDWPRLLSDAAWFHTTGISPAVSKGSAAATRMAVTSAQSLGLMVSVDLNYRRRLWRWGGDPRATMTELVSNAQVLIASVDHLAHLFPGMMDGTPAAGGWDDREIDSAYGRLRSRFPLLRTLLVTFRVQRDDDRHLWSAATTEGGGVLRSREYLVGEAVDRVGAGDAFAASWINSRMRGSRDPQRALDEAAAAGYLKHTVPGDVAIVTQDEIEALADGAGFVSVER